MSIAGNWRTRDQLLRAVRRVRRRWRLKLVLRGLALTLAGTLPTFLVSASTLEFLRFQPEAVMAFRVVLWLVIGFLLVRSVLWPLLRPVSDDRVALYLEENEPSLQSRVLTAVESTRRTDELERSPLLQEVVRNAVQQCRRIDGGRGIERTSIRRSTGMVGGLALASVLLVALGPGFLRHGLSALFNPARAAESVNPYSVAVRPGDTTISRNSDLTVSATLHGFDSDDVVLHAREAGAGGFAATPMIEDGAGSFEGLLLNVAEETTYHVEAAGVRSGTFTLRVADLPAVDRLEMVFHFPRYTGLAPRSFEYGGDVAALAGTHVVLTVTPTIPSPGSLIVMDSGDTITLEAGPEGTFTGAFTVRERGFYGIRFLTRDGLWVTGAPDYRIDVLRDQGPSVSFAKPGRDISVSAIEEVFLEARADDDLGLSGILLVYNVNGGSSDTVSLFAASGPPMPAVTAGHTVFMEDYELETGDLVAYHAVARDNAPSPNEALTDIHFLQVRPFRRDYRERQGGGGDGGGMEQDLSGLQRQIVAASFNLVRDRDSYAADAWEENVVSVALNQERLREQVETLARRIVNRGITGADESFRHIAEALPVAVEAMNEAVDSLRALNPRGAIAPEQRSLRQLQKAEEMYERFVSRNQQQRGGGGRGRRGPGAEDLADLFELETDALRNQYETVQRSRRETADQAVDEALEKLRELARRQEQELERQRRRAAAQQGRRGGGGSQAARDLAERSEEEARQLERLSRETGQRRLEEVARELRQAADAMRRSAAQRGNAGVAEAQSALRRLREARDRLEGAQDDRLRRDLDDARDRVEELARRQEDIEDRMAAMREAGRVSQDEVGDIRETKTEMAGEVGDLLARLDQLAATARRDGAEGGAQLDEATETIRETQLRERILYSRGLVGRSGREEYAEAFENQTAQAIQSLRNRLEEAAEAVAGGVAADFETEAMESARDLARSLESMERRMRAGARGGEGPREVNPGDGPERVGAGGPRTFDPDRIRQARREVRERLGEAQILAGLIERTSADPRELQAMIDAMRALDRERTYADPEEVLRLQRELVEGMKQLEFELRRRFAADEEDRLLLHRSGDAPEEYRALVEEYYRELARGRGSGRDRR